MFGPVSSLSTSTWHCQLVKRCKYQICDFELWHICTFHQCLTARFHYLKVISKILLVQLSLSERDRELDSRPNNVAYVLFECNIYPFFLVQATSFRGLMYVLLIFPKLIHLVWSCTRNTFMMIFYYTNYHILCFSLLVLLCSA